MTLLFCPPAYLHNLPHFRRHCQRFSPVAFAHQRTQRTRAICMTTDTMSDRKMLHAVCRVGDLDATRKFLEAIGMKNLRGRDVPSEKYTNEFYGFGPEQHGEYFSLELTYNYGVSSYDLGTGFGYFGVAVTDINATVDRVRKAGFKVTQDPCPVLGKIEKKMSYSANPALHLDQEHMSDQCFRLFYCVGIFMTSPYLCRW